MYAALTTSLESSLNGRGPARYVRLSAVKWGYRKVSGIAYFGHNSVYLAPTLQRVARPEGLLYPTRKIGKR